MSTALITLTSAPALAARPTDASAAFDELKALTGHWEAKTKSGKTIRVSYRQIAGGSVLAETWESPSGKVSMTMFHMDGVDLLLTHYCPQGNQPRLKYVIGAPSKGRIAFRFKDATGLVDESASHMHGATFDFRGPDEVVRTDTYLSKGKPDVGTLTFVRTAVP